MSAVAERISLRARRADGSGGLGLVVAVVGALGAWLLVLFAHGLLPGQVSDLPTDVLTEGAIRCVNDLGASALWSRCHDFGEPVGYPLLTNGPTIMLGALLMALPGVGSYPAYLMSAAMLDALALAGGYALLRRLGAGPVVALGAAVLYLLSPTVIGLESFGGTFHGFALLPGYVLVHMLVMDRLTRGGRKRVILAFAGFAAVQTAALFLDGYSFVVGNLAGAALWIAWGARRQHPARLRWLGAATFIGANLIAALTYLLYVPGVYEANPIDIFRSMGLDVVTLVGPSRFLWAPTELGLATDHSGLWGDGSNASFNYAGFACLILAFAFLVRNFRRPEIAALAVAGAAAFVLALGPSLKVDETRPTASSRPDFNSYLMPEGDATIDFPWSGVFTALPGLEDMRATYRWFGLTRLVLIVLAALAVSELARRRNRRWLAVLAAVAVVVELLPNLPDLTDRYRIQRDRGVALRRAVTSDLQAITKEGERAFFLNYDGSHNDFLANYLASVADVRAYNAGGDKNSLLASRSWSPTVTALAGAAPTGPPIEAALRSGDVDVVLAPLFHLRWAAYSWPPTPQERAQAESAYAGVLADPRFAVERRDWIAAIRLR